MKKIELKFWLSCMVMALCVGFTSCSDDDDEGIADDGEKEEWDEAYTNEVYTFKKDGTGTYKDEYDNSTDPFTWSISGNKLKLTYDDNDSDEVVIRTLNENTAVLVVQYKDKDTEYYDEMTFKKK